MKGGDILLVNFKYQESNTKKKRPCAVLVIDKDDNKNFYGIKLTSTYREGRYNYYLEDWQNSGLDRKTYAVCNRIEHINSIDIIKNLHQQPIVLGNLSSKDYQNVYELCSEYVNNLYLKINLQNQYDGGKVMNINAQVYPLDNAESKVKAVASVNFGGNIAVKNVKIVEGENGLYVQMPQYKTPNNEYENLAFPVTKEFREQLNQAVLNEFHNPTEKENALPEEVKIKVSTSPIHIEKSGIKAISSVTLNDSLVIKNIRVIEGSKGLFVQMPNYKDREGNYHDIAFPVTKEFREKLFSTVLDSYQKQLSVIGNVSYGELKDKGELYYTKVDTKNIEALEKALAKEGVLYSGRVGEDSTTITINKSDLESFKKAENSIKQSTTAKR